MQNNEPMIPLSINLEGDSEDRAERRDAVENRQRVLAAAKALFAELELGVGWNLDFLNAVPDTIAGAIVANAPSAIGLALELGVKGFQIRIAGKAR